MPKPPDLLQQAADFANDSLASLLNNTITRGIRISAALQDDGRCLVGYKVTKNNFITEAIPITIGKASPRCYLDLFHTLFQTDRSELAVASSRYSLYLNEADEVPLLHYDYQRDKEDYPVAHLHVTAESKAWDQFFDRSSRTTRKDLERLHFPVGGKRYRPSLEDLVEFLITEGFVDHHEGWGAVVARHRQRFHHHQLAAAVYRDPETARGALAKYDAAHPPG